MIFRFRWPLRFTLRSLFIATTFLAVVLGMIVWLDRAWIGKSRRWARRSDYSADFPSGLLLRLWARQIHVV